ncbi:MAG: carbonic anhydrase family protein [Ilumatobacteraceae bacterium]
MTVQRDVLGRRTLLASGAAGVAAVLLASCSSSNEESTADEWSYDGPTRADEWGKLVASCADSASADESPINIVTSSLVETPGVGTVVPKYQPATFELENNGHTIEAVPTDLTANSIEIDGTTYNLQQFHFHSTSEHTIDGWLADAEMHLVHKSDDGQTAVLGVLLLAGEANVPLTELFNSIPTKETPEGKAAELQQQINPADLLPAGSSAARYEGSLTTPPCTDGVHWNVFLTPSNLSAEQLVAFRSAFTHNNRPVQPLHGRVVSQVAAIGA